MELDELRKLQATVEDAARAIETGVHKEINSTETELNKVAAEVSVATELPATPAQPEPSPLAAPVAETVAEAVPAAAAASPAATPQLELGLDTVQTPQSPAKPA